MSRQVQTIESTGKLWKFLQLIGVLGILVGAGFFFVGFGLPGELGVNQSLIGIVVGVVAVPVYAVGRVGAWWFHG
jgi:hypothetical protein